MNIPSLSNYNSVREAAGEAAIIYSGAWFNTPSNEPLLE